MTKPRSSSNRTETLLPTALRAAFEKGVDATLKMLRPLLADREFDRSDAIWPPDRYYFDHDDALSHCTSCAEPDGSPHLEQCAWPKIDEILGGKL